MSAADHAATVREVLAGDGDTDAALNALAALVALAERATELEAELAEWRNSIATEALCDEVETLKARATELERERDDREARADIEHDTMFARYKRERERAERAETALREYERALEIPRKYDMLVGDLRDALREIAALVSDNGRYEVVWDADAGEWVPQFKAIARAALGETA